MKKNHQGVTATRTAVLPRLMLSFCVAFVLPLPLASAVPGMQGSADQSQPAVPPPEKILATLRPEHPRVMAEPGTFDALKTLVRGGGLPAQIYAEVKRSADQILSAPVSQYEKPDGRRLLSVSRLRAVFAPKYNRRHRTPFRGCLGDP